ncbi:hypothetical protein AVEN_86893-1 [Araneus ventricosus]|uniref:Uncharacterized protein n=1 Tax=Araneus ventricosus TaxID=182803 RepID=A0A4Y2THR9_ARAVE|nr:hypothetical protein AVEN_86893-1 [Araneus ventricosus]
MIINKKHSLKRGPSFIILFTTSKRSRSFFWCIYHIPILKSGSGCPVVGSRLRGRRAPGLNPNSTLTPGHTAVSRAHVAPIRFGIGVGGFIELQKNHHTED